METMPTLEIRLLNNKTDFEPLTVTLDEHVTEGQWKLIQTMLPLLTGHINKTRRSPVDLLEERKKHREVANG